MKLYKDRKFIVYYLNICFNFNKESDYTINTNKLYLTTEYCGNYEKNTEIPFDVSKEFSLLFNQLKSLKIDIFNIKYLPFYHIMKKAVI